MANGTIQKNMVLLWTNPNPSAVFAAQSISIDASSFSALIVVFRPYNTEIQTLNELFLIPQEEATATYVSSSQTNLAFFYRKMAVSASKIDFNEGLLRVQGSASTSQTRNQYLVPVQIFGIKA